MLNEYGYLRRLILRHARKAYRSQAHLDAWWQRLNYPANVDFNAALAEYDSFAEIISDHGAEIIWLDDDDRLTPDSIYVRDSAVASPDGLVLCQMGKPERQGEVDCLRDDERLSITGEITQPGLWKAVTWSGSTPATWPSPMPTAAMAPQRRSSWTCSTAPSTSARSPCPITKDPGTFSI